MGCSLASCCVRSTETQSNSISNWAAAALTHHCTLSGYEGSVGHNLGSKERRRDPSRDQYSIREQSFGLQALGINQSINRFDEQVAGAVMNAFIHSIHVEQSDDMIIA